MPDPAPCPLSARELIAYELRAEGHGPAGAATVMGTTEGAFFQLLARGRRKLGAKDADAAERILIDAGWMAAGRGMPPGALSYVRAWEAYIRAPRECRDELFIRELCAWAAAELVGDS